jgi:hypothetical protein
MELKMNAGVEILIERMKSNPEEFIDEKGSLVDGDTVVRGRWNKIIISVLTKKKVRIVKKQTEDVYWKELSWLTDEEIDALYDAFMETMRNRFTGDIMVKLAGETQQVEQEESELVTKSMKYMNNNRHGYGWLNVDPRSIFTKPYFKDNK